MPAIRDFTTASTSSTTGTTIVLPMPQYQQNDLLLAVLSTDGTTGVWSSAGWTQLFSTFNSVGLAVFYKIAGATETAPTFTNTVAETYNGTLLAIRDVNTSTPFNGANSGYTTGNISSAVQKFTMPTRTTTTNDCLILYALANQSLVEPSVVQGSATWIAGKDGTAHSDGLAWTYQKNAGTTPTVYAYGSSVGNGVMATVAINPGGANVIPAYCANDDSFFIEPIAGLLAYNGNGGLVTTVTSYFGSTLNGATITAGTVTASAGNAINPYQPAGQFNGLVTIGQWAGSMQTIAAANRPDITGKNILVHVKPTTGKQLEYTDAVTNTGTMGIAIGLCSGANTDYKVWHVHGAGTSWGDLRVPCIINSANTTGLIQNTGSFNPVALSAIGYFVSSRGTAPVWLLTTVWMLDTCTIAGGTIAEPVTIPDIVETYATGHVRMSAIQQGAGQMLLFGPIQFGDGGTNPVNLGLDTSAIEFPKLYDKNAKQVNYCSAENVAGITYYAGANDSIIHRNSVISSASKYKWGFHASSSALATYDFTGLQVIGAGQVSLKSDIPISGITFGKCDEINSTNTTITDCTFSETIGESALAVDSISAMDKVTKCDFRDNNIAIRLTQPGTYTFDAITFSGNTYDIENASTGEVIIINCINGSNPSTYINSNGGTTTINNGVSMTFSGLQAGTEVRIYKVSDDVELFGEESTGTSTTYSYNYAGDTSVYVRIHHIQYEPISLNLTLGNTSTTIPIQQRFDRTYSNP